MKFILIEENFINQFNHPFSFQKNFENCILMPGDTYKYYTIYHFFSIKKTKKQLDKERLDAEALAAAEEILAEVTRRATVTVDNLQSETTGSLLQVI